MASSESSPSTVLTLAKASSTTAHGTPVRKNTLQLIRSGPGLTVSLLAERGGKWISSAVNMGFNMLERDRYKRIKIFFGEDDYRKRQTALDGLHAALKVGSRSALPRKHRDLWDDCHELLKGARNSQSIDTQLVTFCSLISIITRYPGLRRRFSDHKDLRKDEKQSETHFNDNLWKRELQSCGEEWLFYRDFAAYCIIESPLAKLVEAEKPSELGRVESEAGTMNKVPIEELLGYCRDGTAKTGIDFPRICAIRYLGGILVLPSFWEKRGSDEGRFFVVLCDVCNTVFRLIHDTGVEVEDTSVDMSHEMCAAREAVDILCTATLNGLLHLNGTKRLPPHWLVRLPDIPSRLSTIAMKTCFPDASAVASYLLAQSLFAADESTESAGSETAMNHDAAEGTNEDSSPDAAVESGNGRRNEPGANGGDIYALIERLEKFFLEEESYIKFLAIRGASAQRLLDMLEYLLDYDVDLATSSRRRLLEALIRLSRNSNLYPRCLTLTGLEQERHVAGGSFGDVYKGLVYDQSVAVKMMRVFDESDIDALLKEFGREALIWRQLSHPNLLPFFGLYYFQQRLCLVSPWMENGHIRAFLNKKSHETDYLLSLILDVALGLQHLHSRAVVHGDLKGDSIFVTPSHRACIADFGLSSIITSVSPAQYTNSSKDRQGGTVRYQAPELHRGGHSDQCSDIYAFALVAYELLTGMPPFPELPTDMAVALAVIQGRRPSRPPSAAGTPSLDGLWNLIQDCWTERPEQRPTAAQIVECLMGPDIRATTTQSTTDWDDRFTSRFRRNFLHQRPPPSAAEFENIISGGTVADNQSRLV